MSPRGDGNGFVIRRDFSASVRVRPPAPNSEIYANKEDAKLTGVLGAFPPLYAGVAQMVEQLHDQRARVRVRPPAPKVSKLP